MSMILKTIRISLVAFIVICVISYILYLNYIEYVSGIAAVLTGFFVIIPLFLTVAAAIVYLTVTHKKPAETMKFGAIVIIGTLVGLATLISTIFVTATPIFRGYGGLVPFVILALYIIIGTVAQKKIASYALPLHMVILMLSYTAFLVLIMI